MNMQSSLIQQIYEEFKLGHNAIEATKNLCCAKSEGAVDHNY